MTTADRLSGIEDNDGGFPEPESLKVAIVMNRGTQNMSNRNATICSESIRHELRSLEDQLAEAWWHEKPLECIEHLEQQIEARSAILSKATPHKKR